MSEKQAKEEQLRYRLRKVRSNQNQQLSKAQAKLEEDVWLLDSWREFMKKKAEIELDYCKAMEKLVKHYANAKKLTRSASNQNANWGTNNKPSGPSATINLEVPATSPRRESEDLSLGVVSKKR